MTVIRYNLKVIKIGNFINQLCFSKTTMADKWYNSQTASYISQGLAIATIFLGFGYGVKGCQGTTQLDVDLEKAKANHIIQKADINNNGIIDKFYVIDKNIAAVELDGKSVCSSLEARLLEK